MKIGYIRGYASSQHAADAIRAAITHFGVEVTPCEHSQCGLFSLSVPVDWDSVPDTFVAKEEAAEKVYEAWKFAEPLSEAMGCKLRLRFRPHFN